MRVIESFYRGEVLGQEPRQLPAEIYNQARLLLDYSDEPHVFIPIRSMQYLSVMDQQEIIFVDRHAQRRIEFAWQHFTPQSRADLTSPVPFTFVYYDSNALQTMLRALWEFAKATKVQYGRLLRDMPAARSDRKIVPFPGQDG